MTGEELIAFVKKNMIVVACAVVTLALGFVIYYRTDALPDAEKVLIDKTKEGELLAANIEDSNQLKEQYTAMVAANQVINDRMIEMGQLADNLQYFYRLESETGTKLTDLRQLPWTPAPRNAAKLNFTPIGFAVSAQGDYPKLLELLRRLETGEHYCRVLSCNLKPMDTVSRGGQLQITLNLELLGLVE
ncbi:MAG: hypothetical protein OK454_09875 [Thaumarchaeota archaeon]|jgi:hypothetical protein|nr:hypothetical protein [Nitrososphaerota archaeon]